MVTILSRAFLFPAATGAFLAAGFIAPGGGPNFIGDNCAARVTGLRRSNAGWRPAGAMKARGPAAHQPGIGRIRLSTCFGSAGGVLPGAHNLVKLDKNWLVAG